MDNVCFQVKRPSASDNRRLFEALIFIAKDSRVKLEQTNK